MGVVSLFLLVAFAGVSGEKTSAPPKAAPLHEHPTLVRMLEENNRLRANVGLAPQQMSPELTKAAQDHARYMARTGNFSHESNGGPQGRAMKRRISRTGR